MKKNIKIITIILIALLHIYSNLYGQRAIDRIISDSTLIAKLEPINNTIKSIKNDFSDGYKEKALANLAEYFSEEMSKRYFFNWKNFNNRFKKYKEDFPSNIKNHIENTNEQMELFEAETKWKLPFVSKSGFEITAYELRHLARQHKAIDIMFTYYQSGEADKYLSYITTQVNSLAEHYYLDDYEKDGNAIFEVFRAGYRVFNWLFVYNSLLASPNFTWRAQIDFIKTFYYHSIELEKETQKFHFGNHQTKGLMALALTSMLFPEFDSSEKNLTHTFSLLTEHLIKEVNPDGFQFERSVHYHIGDINNYFYVSQLAKENNIELPAEFETRFKMMFDALVNIAMPNKHLPVLQDDTDEPWAEFNKMGSVMLIGSIIFEEPLFKYFSDKSLSADYYWFFKESDKEKFNSIKKVKPEISSIALPQTGYYVMRNGWENSSEYMIISAGLSEEKPDHQHGDMLGLYAYANGNVILPNYQTRYNLSDYPYFKSSFVKNVAIVDSIPQGIKWLGNSGGSGFGKWLNLPKPSVITWQDNDNYSLFIGSHDGYENSGISYSRMVLFIKDGFYIVKDYFKNSSSNQHNYQQIWQGNYSTENNRLLESTFQNGSGLDIYQLGGDKYSLKTNSKHGKGSTIFSSDSMTDFYFTTLLSPFSSYDERLFLRKGNSLEKIKNWEVYESKYDGSDLAIKGKLILSKGSMIITFSTKRIENFKFIFTSIQELDMLITDNKNYTEILCLNSSNKEIEFEKATQLSIGDITKYYKSYILRPGEIIRINK